MAIAIRSGIDTISGLTPLVVTKNGAALNGDMLLMVIGVVGGTSVTITTPSGWMQIGSAIDLGTTLKQAIYWRPATGAPASSTVAFTPGFQALINEIAISGADLTAPPVSQYGSTITTPASNTLSVPAIGPWSAADGMSLFLANYPPQALTHLANLPAGWTTIHNTGGPSFPWLAEFYKLLSASTGASAASTTLVGAFTTVSIGTQLFIKGTVPQVALRASYYGASVGEPAGVSAETGITLSLTDQQTPAVGVGPLQIPASLGTNYSWVMLLAVQVTGTSPISLSNRRIGFASPPPAGSAIFFADQPTYRDPTGLNKPPDVMTPGPTVPTPTGANAPGVYAALTATTQLWDNTSVSAGATGRNGHFVELVGAVDNTYAGGPGQEVFPAITITVDGA